MKKDPEKKLTKPLKFSCGRFTLTIPEEVVQSMKLKKNDEIIILENPDKSRIELYNKRNLTEKNVPFDFPISILKKRLKDRILPPSLIKPIKINGVTFPKKWREKIKSQTQLNLLEQAEIIKKYGKPRTVFIKPNKKKTLQKLRDLTYISDYWSWLVLAVRLKRQGIAYLNPELIDKAEEELKEEMTKKMLEDVKSGKQKLRIW